MRSKEAIIYLTKEASMRPVADDDSDRNFESDPTSAHASEAKAPGAADVRSRETNASGDRADGAGRHAPDGGNPTATARERAEETGEEEIEITPEMMEAGIKVWYLGIDEAEAAVECIFDAMERARRKALVSRLLNT